MKTQNICLSTTLKIVCKKMWIMLKKQYLSLLCSPNCYLQVIKENNVDYKFDSIYINILIQL